MGKIIFTILIIILLFGNYACAEETPGYQLLQPLGGGAEETMNLSSYIDRMIKIGIVLAALFAVIVIVIAGFMYITAGGNTGTIEKAKGYIWDALIGLLIAVGFWLILVTINPDLLNIDNIVKNIDVDISKPTKTPQKTFKEVDKQCTQECGSNGYEYDPQKNICLCYGTGTHKECQYIPSLSGTGSYQCVTVNIPGEDTCTDNDSCKQKLGCCRCLWKSAGITFKASCTSGANFKSSQSCKDFCGFLPSWEFVSSAICNQDKQCVAQ